MTAADHMFAHFWFAVSGGRDYAEGEHVARVLDEERAKYPRMVVVQGECPYGGADALAVEWCNRRGVPCFGARAAWTAFGRSAGPRRNGWMFDLLPIYKLIAFPGNRGTANAIEQAEKREILVRDERGATPND